MANPIFIAVNRTATPISLPKLALTVPASGQVTLSDYNTASEIQDDADLKAAITSDYLYINDGTNTLNKDQSLAYCSTSAVTTDVGDYVNESASSGVLDGGIVTATGGNGISVSAGSGLCVRGSPYNDVVKVSWGLTNFSLSANTYYYVYYDFSSAAVIISPVQRTSEDIQLAQARSDGSNVRFLHRTRTPVLNPSKVLDQYLIDTRKIALVSGLLASAGTSGRKFQIAAGSYYRSLDEITFAGTGGDATFSAFYGTNGANEISGQTEINITQYDNAGTLTSMTAGYWRTDSLLITSDGRVSVIFGTAEYATQALAEAASFAAIPGMMNSTACTIAELLVQQGTGITKFVDARPATSSNVAGSSGVTDHGMLTGLADDDHTQYLLAAGSRAMSGNLDMGGQNVTNVGTVDGVDISAHVGAGGAAHAEATTSVAGFLSAADKTKMEKWIAGMCDAIPNEGHTDITTTSTTDVAMANTLVTFTGPNSRWLVILTGDLKHSASSGTAEISIYGNSGATRYTTSVVTWMRGTGQGNVTTSFACFAIMPSTVVNAQGYWKTNAATLTCTNRAIVALKIAMP